MYVGSDFVGRMNLPLVAIGERYTVGFGVDPQLQVSRLMVKKSRSRARRQPGPQLRLPDHGRELQIRAGEGAGLGPSAPRRGRGRRRQPARADAEAQRGLRYLRRRGPRTCCGGTSTVEPGQTGEKAATLAYQFKLEYARDVAIANFKANRSGHEAQRGSDLPPAASEPEYPLRRYLRVAATGSRSEQRPAQSRCETQAILQQAPPRSKRKRGFRYSGRDPNRNDGRRNPEKSTMHLSCDCPTMHCSIAQD